MTTTTGPDHAGTGQAGATQADAGPAPGGRGGAAIIAGAVPPHPTLLRTFAAMMAREGRVLRRNVVATFTRSVMQPLLFVFVFTYVMPKIGGAGLFSAGAAVKAGGGVTFATVLLPGLMASMLFMQGIMAVTFPLVMEFSWQRTIEDRALAPVPIHVLAVQKIVAGAVQAFIGALIVFPIVLLVHAAGQSPHVEVTNWALLAVILICGALLTSSLGLLLGTLMDPRKMQMLFAAILLPATMLGCVYYPWSALHSIRWLQIAVLVNPMVYMSEGLRAVLTPQTGHLQMWAILLMLVGGTVVLAYLGAKAFTRRVLN
jgi:ABC-2 type transport system permease protein